MNRFAPHYGLRSRKRWYLPPCVEVTRASWMTATTAPIIKRCYGITWSHAMSRALAWSKAHGDPRY